MKRLKKSTGHFSGRSTPQRGRLIGPGIANNADVRPSDLWGRTDGLDACQNRNETTDIERSDLWRAMSILYARQRLSAGTAHNADVRPSDLWGRTDGLDVCQNRNETTDIERSDLWRSMSILYACGSDCQRAPPAPTMLLIQMPLVIRSWPKMTLMMSDSWTRRYTTRTSRPVNRVRHQARGTATTQV